MIEFGYEGNSNFHTHIFDRSTVEIDYPIPTNPNHFEKCKNQGQSQNLKRKEIDEDDDSVDILNNFSPFSHPQKRMKTSTAKPDSGFCENGTSSSSKLPGKQETGLLCSFLSSALFLSTIVTMFFFMVIEHKATTSQVKEAKVPKDFSLDNPYFKLTMKPAYIHRSSSLVS